MNSADRDRMTNADRAKRLVRVFDEGLDLNNMLEYMPNEFVTQLVRCLLLGVEPDPIEIVSANDVLEGFLDYIKHEMGIEDE